MKRTLILAALLGALVAIASSCSIPLSAEQQAARAAAAAEPRGSEIVVTVTARKLSANAPTESVAKYLAPATVGVVGMLATSANPLGLAITYAASYVGIAAVEQGKAAAATTVTARVPKLPNEPSATIIKADGTTYVLTGPGSAVAPDADEIPVDPAVARFLDGLGIPGALAPQPDTIRPR